jgi:type IV pilus assembly protein PilN
MAVGMVVAWAEANRSGDGGGNLVLFYTQFGALEKKVAHIVVVWCGLRDVTGSQTMNQTVAAPNQAEQLSDSQGVFLRRVAIFALIGGLASAAVSSLISNSIDGQHTNIALLERENTNLDTQIKEIATLEGDINVLQQRQNAVESLQAMRNVPVRMMSALVQSTPETVVLTTVTQLGNLLTVNGVARSNAEVAAFLRNLDAMPERFVHPELVETVSSETGAKAVGARKALTFSIHVNLVTAIPAVAGKAK